MKRLVVLTAFAGVIWLAAWETIGWLLGRRPYVEVAS